MRSRTMLCELSQACVERLWMVRTPLSKRGATVSCNYSENLRRRQVSRHMFVIGCNIVRIVLVCRILAGALATTLVVSTVLLHVL